VQEFLEEVAKLPYSGPAELGPADHPVVRAYAERYGRLTAALGRPTEMLH
jgi:hypothetical protein